MNMRPKFETKSAADDDAGDELAAALAALETARKADNAALESRLTKEVKSLNDNVDRLERIMARRPANSHAPDGDDHASRQVEIKALAGFLNSSETQFVAPPEMKNMLAGSDPDGGYTVLPTLSASIERKIYDQSAIARLADRVVITQGDAWVEPIDVDDLAANWVAEQESRPETSTPQLKNLTIPLREIYCMPKLSQKVIDVSNWDLISWLSEKIGDKFGRTEGAAFITGNGVSQPQGFLNYSRAATADAARPWFTLQTVPTLDANLITADSIKTLIWSLRAPYRVDARFVMNSNTAGAIDKLKDSTGAYIWRDSMAAGVPPTLCGYPVAFDEQMPDITTGAIPVVFGNWKRGYVIAEKIGIKFLKDPFSAKPNVLYYAYRRVGGGLRNSEALKLLTVSAT